MRFLIHNYMMLNLQVFWERSERLSVASVLLDKERDTSTRSAGQRVQLRCIVFTHFEHIRSLDSKLWCMLQAIIAVLTLPWNDTKLIILLP